MLPGCWSRRVGKGAWMDILISTSWKRDGRSKLGRGGNSMAEYRTHDTNWISRHGRVEVMVERSGDSWKVQTTTAGRLFGPPQVIFEAKHRDAKHAAWDVMACVIRASRNEDAGVNAGREVARW